MKIKKCYLKQKLICIYALSFIAVFIFCGKSFASPGIKITKPANGSTVSPGQLITVKVESVDGFAAKEGLVNISKSDIVKEIRSLPVTYTDKIPAKAVGQVSIGAMAKDASGNIVVDDIILNVHQTATLQSLKTLSDFKELNFYLDWNGNINQNYYPYIGSVVGVYSDGIERDLRHDPNTIFISSDPSAVSIDDKGKFQVHKSADNVKIIVSNSGVSFDIPVEFVTPSGIRPNETIPPTITMSTQPNANSDGWYNKGITITLTAKDNEGGSGVKEILYQFPNLSADLIEVHSDHASIPFQEEGENEFWYFAYDNEMNESARLQAKIKIDKTPPDVSISLSSYSPRPTDIVNIHQFIIPGFYKLSYSSTDKLSSVKETQAGLVIPDISGYKTRLIGNKSYSISINEAMRMITIIAPNPSAILRDIKLSKIINIDNAQTLYLRQVPSSKMWNIVKQGNILTILAPSITFKIDALDFAGNKGSKTIQYSKTRLPIPDIIKEAIRKKELTKDEVKTIKEESIVDSPTAVIIRRNYGL